jgi:hypothetical protein
MGYVEGFIIDDETGLGVPSASISLADSAGKYLGVGVISDSGGQFYINNSLLVPGTMLVITSVGYVPVSYEIYKAADNVTLRMGRDMKELPDVIAPVRPKVNKTVLLGAGALLFLLATKDKAKRKVSGILPGGQLMENLFPVILIGGMYIVIKYGPDILEKLGLKQSKDEKDTESAVSDPNSYWDPSFWKKGGTGTLILKGQMVADLMTLLEWSFGAFNDDEAAVINAFKTFKTQSQLSYFADQFQQKKGKRLADWLFSDSWPDDRLSLSEMAEINKYIEKLPKYKV